MKVGDIIQFQGILYTIWLIEDGIYHIIDENGNGKCGNYNWLMQIDEQ
jgi:hypothetical protein